MSKDQCPECHYSQPLHSARCSRIDLDSAKFWLGKSNSEIERAWSRCKKWLETAHRWEAKFRTVKHENNQLRKNLKP